MVSYVMLCRAIFVMILLCSGMLCYDRVMLCCLILLHVVLGRARRYDLLSCHDMLCDAVS